jgi:hypothetical protein
MRRTMHRRGRDDERNRREGSTLSASARAAFWSTMFVVDDEQATNVIATASEMWWSMESLRIVACVESGMLTDARIAFYCKMLASAHTVEERNSTLAARLTRTPLAARLNARSDRDPSVSRREAPIAPYPCRR